MIKPVNFFLLSVFFASSCKFKNKPLPLFQLQENTGINFSNKVEDGKQENSFLFRNFYNGGGVAIGDINNDGLPDVFLTSNGGANKLYLNKGNFIFEDISQGAGILPDDKWYTGATMADVNGDGWLDIYVCTSGHMGTGNRKNKLFINQHPTSTATKNVIFKDEAAAYGLDISAYTTQVSFFDYDLDGDLDCFMINNSPIPVNQLQFSNRRDLPENEWPVANFLKGGGDHLYRNDGPPVASSFIKKNDEKMNDIKTALPKGGFTETTKAAGIHGSLISFGLGVSVSDINNDGYPDVFVSNDSYERDYLYINQKNGTFKDELEQWMQHTSFSSMGADIADINNDGYQDLFTTDMLPLSDYRMKTTGAFDNIDLFNAKIKAGFYYQYTQNCLQLNNGNGKFAEMANYAGVPASDWSWGGLMFDMDNDGYNDIYVCNGVNRDVTNLDFMNFFADETYHKMVMTGEKKEVDQVVKQIPRTPLPNKVFKNNGSLKFTDMATAWGLDQPGWSNGAAYADLDNDGDLDLIVNNENNPAYIYKNNAQQLNSNNYLSIVLKGLGQNTFAIGSSVKLYAANQVFTREMIPSRGFQSSVDYKMVVGLGKITAIDSVVVGWPGSLVTTQINPAINRIDTLWQSNAKPKQIATPAPPTPFFSPTTQAFDKHQENDVIDFYNERNVPRLLSREGPKAAIADVNQDGLQDVFIGGTQGHPGQIYLQTTAGKFVKTIQKSIQLFGDFEDVAALFLDYDKDGDPDLLLCPGGNTANPQSREMQLRLFKNDGKGNFEIDATAFPTITGMNVSVATQNDINNDGYPDIFIGARSYPGVYGATPQSYLMMNDGKGHFYDVAKTNNAAIANVGMVCGATWANVYGNANKELIIVGEWMSPKIFTQTGDHFEAINTNLDSLYGWWQSVAVADVNNDGKPDLVLGNMGNNFYLQPTPTQPVKLWVNDFDNNGTIDKIITHTISGNDMPVFLKRDMEEQIPSLKKQNLKHDAYATKTMQQLFSKEAFKNCITRQVNYTTSCVAINNGNGNFTIQPLPVMAQLSCINAIQCVDVNGDGYTDLVTGGNQFGFLPQFERLDASLGDVLINNGKGQFIWQNAAKTGLHFRGEMRDIQTIITKKNTYLLFLQNDALPVLATLNRP